MKRCTKCGDVKSVDNFSCGDAQCKQCKARAARDYRRNNPEKISAIKRTHYLANADKLRQQGRNKYYANREKHIARSIAWQRQNADKVKERWKAFKSEGRLLLRGAKARAKKGGLGFDLTLDDIRIPDVCPVLGIRLAFGDGAPSDASPSLDRVDNSKGYIRGNVIVVSRRANSLKRDATFGELRRLADYYEQLAKPQAFDGSLVDEHH